MKGAQEVRKKRAEQRTKEQQKKEENVEILEELVLERFMELETTTVTVWGCEGFFVIGDDDTDIPFHEDSFSALYKDFNDEDGYHADFVDMIDGRMGLQIRISD